MKWNGKNTTECNEQCEHVWMLHSYLKPGMWGSLPKGTEEFRICKHCEILESKGGVKC